MTEFILGWFIVEICTTVFVMLCFIEIFRKLSEKRKRLAVISEQVKMHHRL